MLLGELTLASLRQDAATPWFARGYDRLMSELNSWSAEGGVADEDCGSASFRRLLAARSNFAQMEILVFVGTWCPDCHEHLPVFARIVDEIRFPADRVRVFGLDRSKAFPGGEALIAQYGVQRLPTFIFLREGREIGRIVERPRVSLLEDWVGFWGEARACISLK